MNADDELQAVPNFSDRFAAIYQNQWLRYDKRNLRDLIRVLKDAKPTVVLASDLDLRTRLILSAVGRKNGFSLAVRSDKNQISQGANTGARLFVERRMYQLAFGALFGVSELTFDYYGWKNRATRCLFPYSTDQRKFTAKANERENMRRELGLKEESFLFLAAVKFHQRENPFGIIEAFSQVATGNQNARLIILGSGPQHASAQDMVPEELRNQVSFPGYIPYAKLQNYFFAANAFIHLPEREPWGVSVQDALFCKLPVIASDRVGSAIRLMQGQARRFIVKHTDLQTTVELMRLLIHDRSQKNVFLEPQRMVTELFTAERVARNLAAFFQR